MFFKQIDLTTALRPSLLSDEALLFVQDGVGLYEGYVECTRWSWDPSITNTVLERKYKIPNYQQGYAYLTTLRVCYIDEKDPRKSSVALDLREVDRVEYQVRGSLHVVFTYSDEA
jgi:ESCRT-II complex subunit VPS36